MSRYNQMQLDDIWAWWLKLDFDNTTRIMKEYNLKSPVKLEHIITVYETEMRKLND